MLGSLKPLEAGPVRSPQTFLAVCVWSRHEWLLAWSGFTSCLRTPKAHVLRERTGGRVDGGRERVRRISGRSCIRLWPRLKSHTASFPASPVGQWNPSPLPRSMARKFVGWDMYIFEKYNLPQGDNVWIKNFIIFLFYFFFLLLCLFLLFFFFPEWHVEI